MIDRPAIIDVIFLAISRHIGADFVGERTLFVSIDSFVTLEEFSMFERLVCGYMKDPFWGKYGPHAGSHCMARSLRGGERNSVNVVAMLVEIEFLVVGFLAFRAFKGALVGVILTNVLHEIRLSIGRYVRASTAV